MKKTDIKKSHATVPLSLKAMANQPKSETRHFFYSKKASIKKLKIVLAN
jgi:hypothetical protein